MTEETARRGCETVGNGACGDIECCGEYSEYLYTEGCNYPKLVGILVRLFGEGMAIAILQEVEGERNIPAIKALIKEVSLPKKEQ